jgi:hypothetical protein
MQLVTLTQPRKVAMLLLMKCNWLFPTELYVKLLFRLKMGYKLNLKNPKTFNEKLQWLKLYANKPEYTGMVDKVLAKEYVKPLIGEKYIIPTLGVWERPEEIDFDSLPNQFVLKTTDGGGSVGVVICTDKSKMNKFEIVCKLNNALKQNIYGDLREQPYKNIKKRILAEQFLSDDTTSVKGDLNDYKFYCFNGKVTYCEVITGRRTKKQIDFFDLDWNHIDFTFNGYDFADILPTKPKCFDEMVEVSGKLCKNKPYSRIDLYVVGEKVFFGEITLFPASGFRGFHPEEWNKRLGDMIELPKI